MRSPIRLPGGKFLARKIITPLIIKNIEDMAESNHLPHTDAIQYYEPFFGGGHIGFDLLSHGYSVKASDVYEPLCSFYSECTQKWKTDEMIKRIRSLHPMTKQSFSYLKSIYPELDKLCGGRGWRSSIFYAINKASYAGLTFSGGYLLKDNRFTLSTIDGLERFCSEIQKVGDRFSIECETWKRVRIWEGYSVVYYDPPYHTNDRLYGNKGDLHIKFNHEKLCSWLKFRNEESFGMREFKEIRWLLSYNDCPEIRETFSGYRIEKVSWYHGMNKGKAKKEILIFSDNFIG